MRWKRGHVSSQVEDRRGRRGGVKQLSGAGLIVVIIAVLLGRTDLLDQFGSSSSVSTEPTISKAESDELYQFVSFALDDQQATWTQLFKESGQNYALAELVVFTDRVRSACGSQDSAIGPFYCPADKKAYIDLGFYRELKKLGGPGDFAQAYVLAHEIGHHVQSLLGTSSEVRRQQSKDKTNANRLSIAMELQADCYAGVWSHYAAQRNLLEIGDLEEGLNAAAAIGDDTLQRRGSGRVAPESWTHGSSAQRVQWFRKGYEAGAIASCDTFTDLR